MRHARTRRMRGSGIFMFFAIVLFLVPMLMIMMKNAIFQSRVALKDRNIKTSRELAEAVTSSFMQTFSLDWHRNPFDNLLTLTNNPDFFNLGTVTYTINPSTTNMFMDLQTVATYNKPGISSYAKSTKGVRSLVEWRNDITRFALVWDGDVNYNLDVPLSWRISTLNFPVYVGGHLSGSPRLNNFVVVRGTMTLQAGGFLGAGARLFCDHFSNMGGFNWGTVISYGNPQTVPWASKLTVINPGALDRLNQYTARVTSMSVIPAGMGDVTLTLGNEMMTATIGAGVPTNWAYPGTSTSPLGIVIKGANVILSGVVTRRMYVASVRDGGLGGDVTVRGNLSYLNCPGVGNIGGAYAGPTQSLAVLAEGRIVFDHNMTQHADGVYYSQSSEIEIVMPARQLRVHGTVVGMISRGDIAPPAVHIIPDRNLLRNPPMRWPRRPHLVQLDYVP